MPELELGSFSRMNAAKYVKLRNLADFTSSVLLPKPSFVSYVGANAIFES